MLSTPGGKSGFVEHARDRDDRTRRVLGSLEDDRAPGPDGRGDLADRLVERKIPRGERSAHTDRLAQYELAHVRQPRRDHAAVDAPALLGVPVAVVGAARHFAHAFGQRLALIERDVPADRLGALARELADLAQDAALLERRNALPGHERALRRCKRSIEIGPGRVGQLADDVAGRGVEHVLDRTIAAFDEFAVDIQAQVFVHGDSFGFD